MAKTKSKQPKLQHINIDRLLFDPQNPRFASASGDISTDLDEETIIKSMLKKQNLAELMVSIADQGYFEGEPLLVIENGSTDTYLVAEGNRRLTALKVLNGQFNHLLSPSFKELVDNAKHKPEQVPCMVFSERSDVLHYLGYRHITGVKEWGALEKAIYLKQLEQDIIKNTPNLSADEVYYQLGREIGSRSDAVKRSLASLAFYKLAVNQNFWNLNLPAGFKPEFSFIGTALGYSGINKFLNIDNADPTLSGINEDNAKKLFSWMFYPIPPDDQTILGESRNIKYLAAIVQSPEAVATLEKHRDLKTAFTISAGPTEAVGSLLKNIVNNLDQIDTLLNHHNANITDHKYTIETLKTRITLLATRTII